MKLMYIIFLFIKPCINGTFQFMITNHGGSKELTFVWCTFRSQNSFISIVPFEPPRHSSVMWQIGEPPINKYRNETYCGEVAYPRSHSNRSILYVTLSLMSPS